MIFIIKYFLAPSEFFIFSLHKYKECTTILFWYDIILALHKKTCTASINMWS